MRDIVFIYDIVKKYADLDKIGNKSHRVSRGLSACASPLFENNRLLKTIRRWKAASRHLSRFVYRVWRANEKSWASFQLISLNETAHNRYYRMNSISSLFFLHLTAFLKDRRVSSRDWIFRWENSAAREAPASLSRLSYPLYTLSVKRILSIPLKVLRPRNPLLSSEERP